jgi:hypothetical protein
VRVLGSHTQNRRIEKLETLFIDDRTHFSGVA